MFVAGCLIVLAILLVAVDLAIVEFRRIEPLVFRCRRCGELFRRPAYRDFPHACPRCGAHDWAR